MNRGTGFFCMLGLYKRQSRAEAIGGQEDEQNRRTNREGGTQQKAGERTLETGTQRGS